MVFANQPVDKVKVFAKSTSDRFSRRIDGSGLRKINNMLTALLAGSGIETNHAPFDLKNPVSFDDIYFHSTCLKAPIHFPVDWVLLRDVPRTLMKATVLVRRAGLRHRMPLEPLAFLSDMNTLCMKMTAKNQTKDGSKHRKAVLREMKTLSKRIAKHAGNHLDILTTRSHETNLTAHQTKPISRVKTSVGEIEALPCLAGREKPPGCTAERTIPSKPQSIKAGSKSVRLKKKSADPRTEISRFWDRL